MVCGKHVEMPIPDEEWVCPKCGSSDNFYVDEVDSDGDCDLFHENDVVRCYDCDSQWSVKQIVAKWAKKKNMVKCSCCKGTGWVDGPKEK
jgi:DNA-directed RNA polymerase subunit RPC12/RpoP